MLHPDMLCREERVYTAPVAFRTIHGQATMGSAVLKEKKQPGAGPAGRGERPMSENAENGRGSPDKLDCVWIVESAKSTIERTLRRTNLNDFLRREGEHLYDHANDLYVALSSDTSTAGIADSTLAAHRLRGYVAMWAADLPPELHDG